MYDLSGSRFSVATMNGKPRAGQIGGRLSVEGHPPGKADLVKESHLRGEIAPILLVIVMSGVEIVRTAGHSSAAGHPGKPVIKSRMTEVDVLQGRPMAATRSRMIVIGAKNVLASRISGRTARKADRTVDRHRGSRMTIGADRSLAAAVHQVPGTTSAETVLVELDRRRAGAIDHSCRSVPADLLAAGRRSAADLRRLTIAGTSDRNESHGQPPRFS
jgi:hypothetical protein